MDKKVLKFKPLLKKGQLTWKIKIFYGGVLKNFLTRSEAELKRIDNKRVALNLFALKDGLNKRQAKQQRI